MSDTFFKMRSGRGGKRPGAGRPAGTKNEKTLEKAEARELVRRAVTENLGPLLRAQIHNAMGLSHLMLRDPKTGQFTRVTGSAEQVDKAVKSKNAVWIYTKDPNIQAITDLLNRALDKPAEHVEIAGGGSITIQWMSRGETDDEKESGDVRELSEGDVDETIRHAKKVNGHLDN